MTTDAPRTRSQQLSDRAAAHVRALITSGAIRPGDAVRPENIGAELGVSATPAREALQRLTAEGFLTRGDGRGFLVAPLSGDDIRDVFTTHALLAGELAARAAERGSDDERRELEALHHELIAQSKRGSTRGLEAANHAFHRQISAMSRSPKMLTFLALVNRYVPREFYGSIPGWPEATIEDHEALLHAIRDGDAARARMAMQEHIHRAGALLAAHVDSTAPADSETSDDQTPHDHPTAPEERA